MYCYILSIPKKVYAFADCYSIYTLLLQAHCVRQLPLHKGAFLCAKKKKALTTGIVKTFVVAEAGFKPTSSCGSRKNLRAVRLLDFSDRCAIPCCPSSAAVGAAE